MADIILRGGLDLVSPPALKTPGTLEDCFNYEVGIQPGYSPSGGFERFDGHISPSNTDVWDMTILNASIEPGWNQTIGAPNTAQTTRGIHFSEDGTLMFLIGSIDDIVYRYYLWTPWDISTANPSVPASPTDVTALDTNPRSMRFSVGGDSMFFVGDTNNRIYRYSYAVPFLSNSTGDGTASLLISAQETSPQGLDFSPDGLRMYVCGSQVGKVHQYSATQAWAIGSFTHVQSIDISLYTEDPSAICFTSAGYVFYVADAAGVIHYYSCSTAWDISTATWFKSYDTGYIIQDMYLTPDDCRLFVVSEDAGDYFIDDYGVGFAANEAMSWTKIKFYTDGVARDTLLTGSLGVAASQTIGPTETKVRFAYWDSNDKLPTLAKLEGEHSASFVSGVESITYLNASLDVSAQETSPNGVWFKPDGYECFVSGTSSESILQYSLTKPWDLNTATYSGNSLSYGLSDGDGFSVAFKSNGLNLYIAGNNQISIYTLSTAWDLSTASGGAAYNWPVTGLFVGNDDDTLYAVGRKENTDAPVTAVYQFDLRGLEGFVPETPFYIENLANKSYENNRPNGLSFSADGTRLYISYEDLEEIQEFECTEPWAIETAVTTDRTFWIPQISLTDISIQDIHMVNNYVYITDTTTNKIYWYAFYPDASFESLLSVATDVNDYQNQLSAVASVLRSAVTPAPGSGPVLTEKYYKDQLYAIRDYYHYQFRKGSTVNPKIGQHVLIQDGETASGSNAMYGNEGIVRDFKRTASVLAGKFADDDAFGSILIEPLTNKFNMEHRVGSGIANNALTVLAELYFNSGSTEPVVGAILLGVESASQVTVWRVDLRSGAWADGDAAGVIYCTRLTGAITPIENMNQTAPSNSINVLTAEANYPTIYSASLDANMVYHSVINTGADFAGLYRSTRTGWEKVDLGHEVRFINGTTEPSPVVFGADTDTQPVTASSWFVSSRSTSYQWSASAGTAVAAVSASGGAHLRPDTAIGASSLKQSAEPAAFTEFGIVIPAGARVVGFEVELTVKNADAATLGAAIVELYPFNLEDASGDFVKPVGVQEKRQAIGDLTTAFVAYPFGGENDLWGAVLTRDSVMAESFGITCGIEWKVGATITNMQIDLVRVRVHYVEQGSTIYFYDSVGTFDYATARLVHKNKNSGAWGSGTAEGTLEIYGLTKPQIPTKNIQIRTASAGGGSLIGNCLGAEMLINIPGKKPMDEVNSKYEVITENPYARDDLEVMGFASGAGKAFLYDGNYMRQAHSGLSPDIDKPRHIDFFQFRLWLGYSFGEAAISVAGNPLIFDGTLNAVATGFGRPVVGFSPLSGKTMGVFTDRSIYAVTVQGADFDQQVFAPNSGAIEYSMANVGTQTMYADSQGVATPLAVQEYGDFGIDRISNSVNPWLLPRVIRRERPSARGRTDVVNATISRNKNQFRLYFADGFRLTITLGKPGEPPEITRQFLYLNNDKDQYVRVLSTDSEVGTDGRERLFFSIDTNPDYDLGDAIGYCYEEDSGVSYDGSSYSRWIEVVPVVGSNGMHHESTWGLMHLYGMCYGHADLDMTTNTDFNRPPDPANTNEDEQYRLALGAATNDVQSELAAFWDKQRPRKRRGRHLSMRFQSETDRELPHVLQHIWLDDKSSRQER